MAVSDSQPFSLALRKEAGVLATVVADRDGASSKAYDLDPVWVTGCLALVVMVPSMDRIDGVGSHRPAGLLMRQVDHQAALLDADSINPWNLHARFMVIG